MIGYTNLRSDEDCHEASSLGSRLAGLRADIDAIDEHLRLLLFTRLQICQEVARLKPGLGMSLVQSDRVLIVQAAASRFAKEHGMSESFMRQLYELIIDEAHRLEAQVIAEDCTG